MIRRLLLSCLAAPMLTACLTTDDGPARRVAAPAADNTAAPAAPAQHTHEPAKELAAQPPAAPEPTYPDIDTLKGEASGQVTSLLGQPDFRRTDKPAELWQYRHERCSVDLFLYPRDGGGLTVDYLDVRTFGESELTRQACFVAILKARATDGRG